MFRGNLAGGRTFKAQTGVGCLLTGETIAHGCDCLRDSQIQPTPWILFSKSTAHCLEKRVLFPASPGDKEQCFAKSIKQKTPTVSSLFKQSLVL